MTTATLPEHPDVSYWVGSNSEVPLRIMFTHEDARASDFTYLDGFDGNGEPMESYKLIRGNYTTEF